MDTWSNVEELIQYLNDLQIEEIAIPGNWSSQIFLTDLGNYPVKSKKDISKYLYEYNIKYIRYREFFKKSRGYDREIINGEIWEIFDRITTGPIMIYLENWFLQHINEVRLSDIDKWILKYIKILSESQIDKWDNILKNIGCINFKFFCNEPELYYNQVSDFIIIETLKDVECDSRSELLRIYKSEN